MRDAAGNDRGLVAMKKCGLLVGDLLYATLTLRAQPQPLVPCNAQPKQVVRSTQRVGACPRTPLQLTSQP